MFSDCNYIEGWKSGRVVDHNIEGPGSNSGGQKCSDGIGTHLPCLGLAYIIVIYTTLFTTNGRKQKEKKERVMRLIVVSVCSNN